MQMTVDTNLTRSRSLPHLALPLFHFLFSLPVGRKSPISVATGACQMAIYLAFRGTVACKDRGVGEGFFCCKGFVRRFNFFA